MVGRLSIGLFFVVSLAMGFRASLFEVPIPRIAPQFIANTSAMYELYKYDQPVGNFTFNMSIVYDEKSSRGLLQGDSGMTLVLSNFTYRILNGECNPASAVNITFQPAFSWLNRSEYLGKFLINGVKADGWQRVTELYGQKINMTLFTAGNTPVRFILGKSQGTETFSVTYDFVVFKVQNSLPDSIFQVPKECWEDFVCPNGTIETMEFYRFHPLFDWDLTDHNAADLLGDTLFLCISRDILHDQLISLLEVQVNTSWGQYAMCNNHTCVGFHLQHVGREGPGSTAPHYGQCSPNLQTGSWFSFPSSAACTKEQNIEQDECAWKLVKRMKTISVLCLYEHAFLKSCFDRQKAKDILNNAFVYDDKTKGGCPPINPIHPPTQTSRQTQVEHSLQKHDLRGKTSDFDLLLTTTLAFF